MLGGETFRRGVRRARHGVRARQRADRCRTRGDRVRPGTISIDSGPGNCAFAFQPGERYIIYARRDPSSGELSTSMCTRTHPLSDPRTRADLALFDRLRKRTPSGNLVTGVVFDATLDLANPNVPRPLAGVRVTASPVDGGPPRTTTTRADGTYEFTAIPPGSVRITAVLPPEFEPYAPVVQELRDPGGCAEADIRPRIDGRIRGQLLDEGGQPLRSVDVQLADAARARSQIPDRPPYLRTLTATTGEDGRFEFRQVGPGRYVLGVALQEPLRAGKLGRRRFYSDALDPASATLVEVGKAQQLELAPFKLTPLPSDRAITITVQAPTDDIAVATKLFVSGATREPLDHHATSVIVRLPFGANFMIQAVPPDGYRIAQPAVVRIDREDVDRAIEFRVERP